MFVKISGLRTVADVECAIDAGADAVGFVLTESPRQVTWNDVDRLAEIVPPEVLVVGVFRRISVLEIRQAVAGSPIEAVQLHGNGYGPADFAELTGLPIRLIRAMSMKNGPVRQVGAYGEDILIVDSDSAGSGQTWNWSSLAGETPAGQWMLAGGLAPDNVAKAIDTLRPWGVDVSSGVESARGVKDHSRIRRFIAAARGTPTA